MSAPVVETHSLAKTYGLALVLRDVDLRLLAGAGAFVIGGNGAGKSTVLKLVTGATEPDDGKVALGGSVKMGYFAQHAMDLLDGERTIVF